MQQPHQRGDPRALRLLQQLLRPLMLRRTKASMDQHGRPILTLPPVHRRIVECEFSREERDFYDALHRKSKASPGRLQSETIITESDGSALPIWRLPVPPSDFAMSDFNESVPSWR